MANDLALQVFRQFADSAWRCPPAMLLSRRIVFYQVFACWMLFELLRDLFEFFDREQQQLIWVDPFLPGAPNALEEEFDLMFERSDPPLFLRERFRELLGDRFVLRFCFFQLRINATECILRFRQ